MAFSSKKNSHEIVEYEKCLEEWEKGRFAPPPEAPPNPTLPKYTEMVPMRDGTRLYTEIFLPSESDGHDSSFPTILTRSPYPFSRPSRNDRLPITRFLDAGFAYVFQLTRGQGASEGVFKFFQSDGEDGYDAVEWIAGQNWCNGAIGMFGSSYSGGTQLLAAKAAPPSLKCIMPTAFVGNFTTCFPFSYGVPMKAHYMQWHTVADAESWDSLDAPYGETQSLLIHKRWGAALERRPLLDSANDILEGDKLESWRNTIAHPADDEFWDTVHFTNEELALIDIPMFFTDGWYDSTVGPIDFFSRLVTIAPDRDDVYLLVGPWNHAQTASVTTPLEDDGDRVLPVKGAYDIVEQSIIFFDRYLNDNKNSIVLENRAKVYVADSAGTEGGEWITFSSFPPPQVSVRKLFLHSDGDAALFPGGGKLDANKPGKEPFDQFYYDPAVPTSYELGSSRDRRPHEIRSDVLTYTSDPFDEATILLGEIVLVLYASSDGRDTDWFTSLTEVFADGSSKSFYYAPPGFRARYRQGQSSEVLLVPNEVTEFRLPMGPAGHKIAAGNRLRLSVFSSAYPEFDPNTNTGAPAHLDTKQRVAQQRVFHDCDRHSHLLLPVFRTGKEG